LAFVRRPVQRGVVRPVRAGLPLPAGGTDDVVAPVRRWCSVPRAGARVAGLGLRRRAGLVPCWSGRGHVLLPDGGLGAGQRRGSSPGVRPSGSGASAVAPAPVCSSRSAAAAERSALGWGSCASGEGGAERLGSRRSGADGHDGRGVSPLPAAVAAGARSCGSAAWTARMVPEPSASGAAVTSRSR
jgi:hypothetical protein